MIPATTPMKWRKLGRVWAPDGSLWWAKSYALLPTVEVVSDVCLRVYFASLDQDMYGRVGFLDLDAGDPTRVRSEPGEPILDIGEPGTFDDSGVNPAFVVRRAGLVSLYYIGWQRSVGVPYHLFAGRADSLDGVHFARVQRTPILDRTPLEPFIRSAMTILVEAGEMVAWYVSGSDWTLVGGKPYPTYAIRRAVSTDGVTWLPDEALAIELADSGSDEFGLGRPWVVRDASLYRMWYSIRSRSRPYRLGYAESRDGVVWTRRDDLVGISASATGWDSEMICYPCVVDVIDRRYMFYNGNRHGSTGFGVAVLEED